KRASLRVWRGGLSRRSCRRRRAVQMVRNGFVHFSTSLEPLSFLRELGSGGSEQRKQHLGDEPLPGTTVRRLASEKRRQEDLPDGDVHRERERGGGYERFVPR